jgi:excisionase family DNA binding protein
MSDAQEPSHDRDDEGIQLPTRSGIPVTLMTPAEVAARLHVDANTLARWSKNGKLTAVRTPGGHRRYLAKEVARLMRRSAERRSLWDE